MNRSLIYYAGTHSPRETIDKNLNFHDSAVPTGQFILKVSRKNRIVSGAQSSFAKNLVVD